MTWSSVSCVFAHAALRGSVSVKLLQELTHQVLFSLSVGIIDSPCSLVVTAPRSERLKCSNNNNNSNKSSTAAAASAIAAAAATTTTHVCIYVFLFIYVFIHEFFLLVAVMRTHTLTYVHNMHICACDRERNFPGVFPHSTWFDTTEDND